METPRKKPIKKFKNVNANQLPSSVASSSLPASSSFAYKHFNSANGKRRKNRKKYFEHDTRTRTIRTSVATSGAPNAAAAIKKIKFNNEIRIVETKCNNIDVDGSRGKMRKKKMINKHACNNNNNVNSSTNAMAQKKRAKQQFRRITSAASNVANIQSTTQKLQKQLIETQKRLQQQLNAMQEHQREQNDSFLALLHSNCAKIHPNAKHDNNSNGCTSTNNATVAATSAVNHHHQHHNNDHHDDQLTQAKSSLIKSSSIASSTLLTKTNPNQSNPCSEHYFTHNFFTDQSKCSIDKMANGNKATAIR